MHALAIQEGQFLWREKEVFHAWFVQRDQQLQVRAEEGKVTKHGAAQAHQEGEAMVCI